MRTIEDDLVDKTNPEAHKICGLTHHKAKEKAMLRLAQRGLPHKKFGQQIVFYLPSLRAYMAARQAQAASTGVDVAHK